MNILAVNAGSATLKFALHIIDDASEYDSQPKVIRYTASFLDDHIQIKGNGETELTPNPEQRDARYGLAYQTILEKLPKQIDCVVHRVVHGGDYFDQHQLISPDVIDELKKLIPFAPLHQPFNLKLIELTQALLPKAQQVACFDTQFHHTIPDTLRRYAIPNACYENGEKIYGFHGLSYEYISQYFMQHHPEYAKDHILIAHIGSGASLCGIKNGQSSATSMGFSTIDGLPMSSRSGQIDPGLLLFWLSRGDSINTIEKRLYKESGLKGLSGISSDFKVVSESNQSQAQTAIAVFTARINQQIGSTVAALGGIQHFVFTAGIGENESDFRAQLVGLLSQWLPIALDTQANKENRHLISLPSSKVKLWVIPTDEEQVMVNHAKRLLQC